MTALPDNATKNHLDQSSDDPRQARSELATLVDKFNQSIGFLTGLFGGSGEKEATRSALGVAYASNQESIAGELANKVVTPAGLNAAIQENGGGAWKLKEAIDFSDVSEVIISDLLKTTKIIFEVVGRSGSGVVHMRSSSDNGQTFDAATADYLHTKVKVVGSDPSAFYNAAETFMDLQGGSSTQYIEVTLSSPSAAGYEKIFSYISNSFNSSLGELKLISGAFVRQSLNPINSLRIYQTSGTFTGRCTVLELS